MKVVRHPAPWLGLFSIWWGTLWWLSSRVNHVPAPLGFQASDKVLHFGYFAVGGVVLGLGLRALWGDGGRHLRWLLGFAVLATTGALDEVHQAYVPGRSGHDLLDFVADLLGSAAGLATAEVAAAFVSRRR